MAIGPLRPRLGNCRCGRSRCIAQMGCGDCHAASPSWYQGRKAIAEFSMFSYFGVGDMFPGKARNRWRLISTRSNGAPAFVIYQRDEQGQYQAFGLQVLILQRGKIAQIINFIDPSLSARFGLPTTV